MFVKTESLTKEKITIELYVTNDVSEDPSVRKLVDQTVGWLEFFPSTYMLQDITNDIETPENLTYDKSILKNLDIIKLCFFTNEDIKKRK